jgi:hypothetical protein
MADTPDAYKLATEAAREATKQLIVVTGGLLAGYLAFLGRTGTAPVLDTSYARWVVALLFLSLLLSVLSLLFVYLMHAARSRRLYGGNPRDGAQERWHERFGAMAGFAAFACCLAAVAVIVVPSFIH